MFGIFALRKPASTVAIGCCDSNCIGLVVMVSLHLVMYSPFTDPSYYGSTYENARRHPMNLPRSFIWCDMICYCTSDAIGRVITMTTSPRKQTSTGRLPMADLLLCIVLIGRLQTRSYGIGEVVSLVSIVFVAKGVGELITR